jgi:hypothetical protein
VQCETLRDYFKQQKKQAYCRWVASRSESDEMKYNRSQEASILYGSWARMLVNAPPGMVLGLDFEDHGFFFPEIEE